MVGSEVQKVRLNQGLTQEALSARCMILGFDISRVAVSHIERGHRSVTDLEMYLLAKALRCDIKELVPREIPAWEKDTRSKPNSP